MGHVTHDRLAHGLYPGGSALYAGLAAAALGAKVRVYTSFGSDFIGRELLERAGVELLVEPAPRTTYFEETYSNDGRRSARVRSRAEVLTRPAQPTDVVFACPVINEVAPCALATPPGALLGLGMQGWLRRLEPDGTVQSATSDFAFVPEDAIAVCSREDLGAAEDLLVAQLRQRTRLLVVTDGSQGAIVYASSQVVRVHARPTEVVDPTGAGDVFAACFLIAIASGKNEIEAAIWGTCGASLIIAAPGTENIAELRHLEDRVDEYRRRVAPPEVIL
jgi:1D-myo-inositol 3-kinase